VATNIGQKQIQIKTVLKIFTLAVLCMSIATSPKFPCCKLNFLYVWVTQQLPADHLLFEHSGM